MPNKFFGSYLNSVLLLVLIILMIVALRFMYKTDTLVPPQFQENNVVNTIDKSMPKVADKSQILGNKDDLVSFSISPNDKLHGVVSYRGTVSGGYFFEGNILINILDSNKKVLKNSNAMATSDWMTSGPVDFEGNIDFTVAYKGKGFLEIQNDDPSGGEGGPAKKILIPIIIE